MSTVNTLESAKEQGSKIQLLKVSLPIIVSQSCDSIMMFTDRYLLSNLGTIYPSASFVGSMTSFLMCITFYGILGYATPLTGQYLGAKKEEVFPRIIITGLFLSILIFPFVLILGTYVGPKYFEFLKIPQDEFILAMDYFTIVNIGIFFIFVKTVIAGFYSGIGKTSIIMKINFLGVIINYPISKYLIGLGLGIKGAAYGTIISEGIVAICFVFSWVKSPYFPKGSVKKLWQHIDLAIISKFFRFGLHTGLEFFVLFFAFNSFINLFHSYGVVEAFSITVALNWEILVILPLVGLNIGLMGQIGQAMGAKDIPLAKKITKNGFVLAFSFVFVSALLLVLFPLELIDVFKSQSVEPAQWDLIVLLATQLIMLMPLYLFFDATNFVLSATLRGSGDTRFCLLVSIIGQWGCLIFSYLFKQTLNLTALDLWKLFILSLMIQSMFFVLRYKTEGWTKIQVV